MSDYDASIAALLDQALPRDGEPGDWERVLADARQHRWEGLRRRTFSTRRRRIAVICLSALVVAVIPLTALGVANNWWFLAQSPKPAGPVVVLESGRWNGVPWKLTGYRSTSEGLCLGLTPNPPTGRPQRGSSGGETPAMACGAPVRGAPGLSAHEKLHEVGYLAASSATGRFPGYVTGPTASDVATVKVVLADGSTVTARTFAAPATLGVPVRFYLARIDSPSPPHVLIALDQHGHILERFPVRRPPTIPGAGSTPKRNTSTVTVNWG